MTHFADGDPEARIKKLAPSVHKRLETTSGLSKLSSVKKERGEPALPLALKGQFLEPWKDSYPSRALLGHLCQLEEELGIRTPPCRL